MGSNPKDVAAKLIVKRSLQEHEPADDTDKFGDGIDRSGALSGLLIVAGTCNVASGDGTAVLTISVQHSDEDDNYDDDLVEAFTHNLVATETGEMKYCYVLPLDLSAAQKWIRPTVKLADGDITTIDEHTMTGVFVLGGLVEKPHADYDSDGYDDNDLSDATT